VKLAQIVAHLEFAGATVDVIGDLEISIDSVTHDSRQVGPGTLFACLPGDHVDGHDFAVVAVMAGATALLTQRRLTHPELASTPQLVVTDTRRILGTVSALVAGWPSARLTTVGVTGTNGKTTVAAMLTAIFEANAWSTGVIGTLHGPRTTPEAPELQQTLAAFIATGNTAAVLEVSSHALALHRVDGTTFDAVVFTNLGHDHLDLHGTPEEYFRAKASLFTSAFAPLAVINADDTHGGLLIDVTRSTDEMTVVPYSVADLERVEVTATSITFRWRGCTVRVSVGGDFNVSNALAALETAVALGISPANAASGLATLPAIPGRFESVSVPDGGTAPFSVVVDYAHTPDGLVEVLNSARAVVANDAAVIVVFGCGGDRDQAKRPAMGAAAAAGADRVIITSDNPRRENPTAIINDIKQGVGEHYGERVTSQIDRRQAIGDALRIARSGDIVVIAGKGHEQTQDLGNDVVAFDDRAVARLFLQDLQNQESTDFS
jgi:UDP-N-acetylmuramoyl-L-alanyl-D-glutamate--2,6-diaminopimelate ligase